MRRGWVVSGVRQHTQKHEEQVARLQDQVARPRALDPAKLAAEVMRRCHASGPDFDCITAGGLAEQFHPRVGMLRVPAVQELSSLVDEGAQSLISAGLDLADRGGHAGPAMGTPTLLPGPGAARWPRGRSIGRSRHRRRNHGFGT